MSNKGRSDGSGMINNVNVFAALSSSRNRKPKGKSSSSSRKSGENGIENVKVVEETAFWAPAPLNVKSWADVDDDDDYYATTVPPQAVWGLRKEKEVKDESLMHVQEIESGEDVLGEVDDDLDEEHESEPDVQEDPQPVIKCFTPAIVFKEPEKQLSKKEIRKKELEELDALLADLNITPNDKNVLAESQGAGVEKKVSQLTVEDETSGSGPAESKNSKKKKKKAKSSKDDVKDIQTQSAQEEDAATIDVKEQLKKLAAAKKKKQSKETDTAAKAAAAEAAARRQKLEAAKKKEKSHHYNQQPVR